MDFKLLMTSCAKAAVVFSVVAGLCGLGVLAVLEMAQWHPIIPVLVIVGGIAFGWLWFAFYAIGGLDDD